METVGKREHEVSGRMVPQFGFRLRSLWYFWNSLLNYNSGTADDLLFTFAER